MILNTPMWFISGLFLCGYLVYFLLAKCEKLFLDFIAPVTTVLFWASRYRADGPGLYAIMSASAEPFPYAGANPIWNYFHPHRRPRRKRGAHQYVYRPVGRLPAVGGGGPAQG